MEISLEGLAGLTATGGDPAATPALHLLDAISLAEAEAHLQNAKIVQVEDTQEPANGRWQPFAEFIPVVVHLAASTCACRSGNHLQGRFLTVTVSQTPPDPQTGGAAHTAAS